MEIIDNEQKDFANFFPEKVNEDLHKAPAMDIEISEETKETDRNEEYIDFEGELDVERRELDVERNIETKRGPGRPRVIKTGSKRRPRKQYIEINVNQDRSQINQEEGEHEDNHEVLE